ncbi:MAG: branched-chain amino acid transaminase [Pseudomonadota bacterium]|nr:branched-chain amino acid transaminase [Pseudomonadota bacterium]
MSFSDRDGFIWMDGVEVPWREANIHILTHSLHYGVAAFEGMRAYETRNGTAIFRLKEHIDRLFKTAHILGMKIPFSPKEIENASIQSVKSNKLKSAYIRPLVFYGSEGMGLHANNLSVHVSIASWMWGTYLGEDALTKGIRVKTSSFTRHMVNSVMCRAKATGGYINSVMALQEVAKDGYDEALLLDAEGMVAEGTGENLFIVKNGELFTPVLTSALEGITRETIIQLAKKLNLKISEKKITRDEVYISDEAFFTGTAAEVTPIRELDGRQIGAGSIGKITSLLQKAYLEAVKGVNTFDEDWLTFIS